MKKKSIFLLLLVIPLGIAAMLIQSCNKENNSKSLSNKIDTKNIVSLHEASEVASNVNKSYVVSHSAGNEQLKSEKYKGIRRIHNKLSLSGKKYTYFYVFNYDGGGYSIISADKRLLPVQAYVDKGSFTPDSLPRGLVGWLQTNAKVIQDLRKSNVKQSTLAAQEWGALECPPQPLKTEKSTEVVCPPTINDVHTVGPFLKTAWSQGCYYNAYCPEMTDGPCGHAWTGCATTAMAQVMAYWKYPSYFDWNAMPDNYASDATAQLMAAIWPLVINPNPKKTNSEGSTCTNDYNIEHAFLNNFNYSSASLEGYVNGINEGGGYNYETVVSNLDFGQPVILGAFDDYVSILGVIKYPVGDGHLWVCDGYMLTQYTTYDVLLFHMNWGWPNGADDGWYAYDNWVTSAGSYNYFKDMIYNIHP